MSSILDSHDLHKLFPLSEMGISAGNAGIRYEYDNFGSGTEEFEDLQQQHAGTGGSSKIKSRPSRKRGNQGHGVYQNR